MAEYINRGDLALWLNKTSCEYSMDDVAPIGWTLKGLINELATFPSADVVKRKTGKWLKSAWSVRCSECGYDVPFTDFCPNCGAKMEETNDH